MSRDFNTWYMEVYKKGEDKRLYHEWLIDQQFQNGTLDEKTRNKVMLLIHESLLQGFSTDPLVRINYQDELCSRVKVPSGMYSGKLFSQLPTHSPDVYKLCIQLKDATKDPIIRQACIAKLNDIRFHKQMAMDFKKKGRR